MSLSLHIVPVSRCLDFHGSPEAGLSTAYSLSGHVLISLSPTVSLFNSTPRSTRLLLSSLELIFEGKSEVITARSGYAGARIISLSKQLLPDGPLEITNDGHEDGSAPATWQAIFNLTLPGWLPASTVFGEDDLSGVSYALYARATYRYLEDDHAVASLTFPWKLAAMCTSPFRSRARTLCAKPSPICINRYSTPSPALAHYTVSVGPPPGVSEPDPLAIPAAILDKIQVKASLPAQVSTTATEVPISLRVRSTNDADINARLRVLSFRVDLEQHEKVLPARSGSYAAAFPVARSAEQPPHRPLLETHPFEGLYSMGIVGYNSTEAECRSWSLVQHDHPLLFCLHERVLRGGSRVQVSNASDADDAETEPRGLPLGGDEWYTFSTDMPVVPAPPASVSALTFFDDDDYASSGRKLFAPDRPRRSEKKLNEPTTHVARRLLRPTFDSPFFKVRHEAKVILACSYRESADGPEFRSEVTIVLPLKFVCARPESAAVLASPASSRSGSPSPYPRNLLPAYSQLFHANGDSRDEVYTDLPAYSKNDERERLLDGAR